MEIRIIEDSWTAEILVSSQSEMTNFVHCAAKVLGNNEADALNGAQIVLDLLAKGRNTFIRVPPEASTDTNFDTKEKHYLGYVRFSVRLEAGSWHYPTANEVVHVPI